MAAPALKATTIKDALRQWEEKNGMKASEAEEVKLYGQLPPIERMDSALSSLGKAKVLSLSTNSIDKLSNLSGLQNLELLSVGRNNLRKIENLEPVSETLQQLWASYNNIDRLGGVTCCKKLRVLYLSNNKIKDWSEVEKLSELPALEELLLLGNPIEQKHSADDTWRSEVLRRLPKLKKLDGVPVEDEERPKSRA